MSGYEALLDSLGFTAADAGLQTGRAQRDRERSLDRIKESGVRERENLQSSFEGRGTLYSGEYQKGVARQQGDEARNKTDVELATGDRVTDIDRELQRAKAQRQLSDESRLQSEQMASESFALQQAQLAEAIRAASTIAAPSTSLPDPSEFSWLFAPPPPAPSNVAGRISDIVRGWF